MPGKSLSENVRRSPRAPARVKVKFTEPSSAPKMVANDTTSMPVPKKRGRKRKNAVANENEAVPLPPQKNLNTVDENMLRPSLLSQKKDGQNVDMFCWICHDKYCDLQCSTCPRVYHAQCLKTKARFLDGQCSECYLQSADGTEVTEAVKTKLQSILPYVVEKILLKNELFTTWKESDDVQRDVINVMDLSILKNRVEAHHYKTTAAFLADVKWILHNCFLVYGPQNQMTIKAKALVNECKNEMIDLEACVECYIRALNPNDDDFNAVCENFHWIVWAKIKGFPYWPAKVLKVIDSIVNVRFFGTHDKGKVAVSQCFVYSDVDINEKTPKKANYSEAREEIKVYLQNLVDAQKTFPYSYEKTKFDPGERNLFTKRKMTPLKANGRPAKRAKTVQPSIADTTTTTTTTTTPVASTSERITPVVDISIDDPDVTESTEDEIEIIEQQNTTKGGFLGNLELRRSQNASPSTAGVSMRAPVEGQSHPFENMETQLPYDENNDELPNSLPGYVNGPVDRFSKPSCSNANDVGESRMSNRNRRNDIDVPSGRVRFLVRALYEAIVGNRGSPPPNQAQDDDMMDNNADDTSSLITKYICKAVLNMNLVFAEFYEEATAPHSNCETTELQLKAEIQKLREDCTTVKENSDKIIQLTKSNYEKEKTQAIADCKQQWDEEVDKKIKAAVSKACEEVKEQVQKEWQEKMAAELAAYGATIAQETEEKVKASCEKAKDTAVEAALSNAEKKHRAEMSAKIDSVKRNQWCAHCLKEARFFCCWNTSYCDDKCQRRHWLQHVDHCENRSRSSEAVHVQQDIVPETKPVVDGKKSKKSDSTNSQTLPTLRLNGQPAQRLPTQGTATASSVTPSSSSNATARTVICSVAQDLLSVKKAVQMPPKKRKSTANFSEPKTPKTPDIQTPKI